MNFFIKWWFNRYSVIYVAFGVALSGIKLHCKVLDYGLEFSIDLPYCLNKLNIIHWFTKGIFSVLLRMCKKPDGISLWHYWKFANHKYLEVEISPVCEIVAFEYQWKIHYDHWGHLFNFSIVGIELSTNICDCRHWDHEKNLPEDVRNENQNSNNDSQSEL